MGFNDKGTRLQFGVHAIWGGSKPTQIRSNLQLETGDLGVQLEYQHTNKKLEKPLTVEGFKRNNTDYIKLTEGGLIERWNYDGPQPPPSGTTPQKNPNWFRFIKPDADE